MTARNYAKYTTNSPRDEFDRNFIDSIGKTMILPIVQRQQLVSIQRRTFAWIQQHTKVTIVSKTKTVKLAVSSSSKYLTIPD